MIVKAVGEEIVSVGVDTQAVIREDMYMTDVIYLLFCLDELILLTIWEASIENNLF